MTMTWPIVHRGMLVRLLQVLAMPTLPLHLATVPHHLATVTALHRDFKVLLLVSKARPPRRLHLRPALTEEEWKNKASQRECQEHFDVHLARSRYSMAHVET